MAITGELITTEATEIDRDRKAIQDMCYGIAFHMKLAEKDAITCPDNIGRKLFRNVATEYRNLVILLHATMDGSGQSQKAMKVYYKTKADQSFDARIEEVPAAKDSEQSARAMLGDLRYFLRCMDIRLQSDSTNVGDLASRMALDNTSKMLGQLGMIFHRLDSGDFDYLSWSMAEWAKMCSSKMGNQTINL